MSKLTIPSNYYPIEPAMENRFVIKITGADIPEYLFRKYKIYNEGEELILTTEFLESVMFTFNPTEFFNITEVTIDYLDPTGVPHQSILFPVKGSNFKKVGDYSSNEITTIKMRFIVDIKGIKLLLSETK
jgi:hypothetical protein